MLHASGILTLGLVTSQTISSLELCGDEHDSCFAMTQPVVFQMKQVSILNR